ncbi:hypothetical protein QQF64_008034 [Cirrhinus molitorella]|uniref:BED-type domain-containing protein n=1 Tax=Cirrhinus molitorella TaxID=172907 RepID=A0ABR3M507_9TELE
MDIEQCDWLLSILTMESERRGWLSSILTIRDAPIPVSGIALDTTFSKAPSARPQAPAAAQSGEKARRNMSAVWNYFKVNEDDKTKADCKLCSAKLSRGGSKANSCKKREKSRDNPRAVKITQAIIEYIALRDQPLSEVENVGFLRLLHVLEPRYDVPSRRYMTDTELPKLHDSVKKHIHSLLQTCV